MVIFLILRNFHLCGGWSSPNDHVYFLFISAYIHLLDILWLFLGVSLSLTSGQLLSTGQFVVIPSSCPLLKMPWIQLVPCPDSDHPGDRGILKEMGLQIQVVSCGWGFFKFEHNILTRIPRKMSQSSLRLIIFQLIELKSPTRWLWIFFCWPPQRNHISNLRHQIPPLVSRHEIIPQKGIRNFLQKTNQ